MSSCEFEFVRTQTGTPPPPLILLLVRDNTCARVGESVAAEVEVAQTAAVYEQTCICQHQDTYVAVCGHIQQYVYSSRTAA